MKMNWRKWNNIIHRDLGYFLVGLTIIYAISGFAVNHLEEWDSNLIIKKETVQLENISSEQEVDMAWIGNVLKQVGETRAYKTHYRPAPGYLQIFVEDGSVMVNMDTGEAEVEVRKNRPFFRELNYLHLNHPKRIWTYVADFYAVGLFLLAITGLFVLKGKNGLKGRGKWFTLAGIIVPVIFLLIYFY
jgi:hypothetical protein